MKGRRLAKRIMAVLLMAGLVGQSVYSTGAGTVYAAEAQADEEMETVYISSREELMEFAENCHLDSYSTGRKFVLTQDLSLSGLGFTTIPYFNGYFDGGGHTISGFSYGGDGYVSGFIRYTGEDAVIENLNLSAILRAVGDKEVTGGLVGVNAGTIIDCSFSGRIYGNSETAGIAAVNGVSGVIRGCSNDGSISGYYYTGGICGKNYGMIYDCSNTGSINDTLDWIVGEDEQTEDLLTEISVEGADNFHVQSGVDTGGIAGYSRGVIIGCENEGVVGYEHAGYNVGGIVGRQSGSVSGCTNRGDVYGRKDLGGIVGQMEPYIIRNDVDSFSDETRVLHDMVNDLLLNLDSDNASIRSDLEELRGYADTAVDVGDAMADQASQYVNANTDVANDASNRISTVSHMMPEITDNMTDAMDAAKKTSGSLRQLNDDLYLSGQMSADEKAQADRMLDDLDDEADRLKSSAEENDPTDKLFMASGTVITVPQNTNPPQRAQVYVNGGWQDVELSADNTITLQADRNYRFSRDCYIGQEIGGDVLPETVDASVTIKQIADTDTRSVNPDSEGYYHVTTKSSASFREETDAVGDMASTLSDLAIFYRPFVKDSAEDSYQDMNDAMDSLDAAIASADKAQRALSNITAYLDAQSDLELVKIDTQWDDNVDTIHSQLDSISVVMGRLGEHASDYTEEVNQRIRAINDQIQQMYSMIEERVEGLTQDGVSYLYSDISDTDMQDATMGKASGCVNYGVIRGDINIGGISGAMAIDEEDPEENAAGTVDVGLNGRYTSQNIIYNCTNRGYITAKGDGAGGIVGFMKNGAIGHCYGYGAIESTGGNYVGGIAGESLAIIRNSYVLCALSGGEYIGGVAGLGTTITGCYSMPTISEYSGKYGAVAGQVEIDEDTQELHIGQLENNFFVSDLLNGVGNISYENVAEPISYDELLRMPGTPLEYRYLTVTFRVEDQYIGAQRINYGDSYDTIEYPEIPMKMGYYGIWPEPEDYPIQGNLVLTANYEETVKVLQSTGTDPETGRRLVLVDDNFDDKAGITAAIVNEPAFTADPDASAHVCYQVALTDSDKGVAESFAIRLYNPYEGNVRVWKYEEDKWVEVEYLVRGSYLQINMKGLQGIFCISESKRTIPTVAIYAGAGVLILILLILLIKNIKKDKAGKDKKKKEEKKDKEA